MSSSIIGLLFIFCSAFALISEFPDAADVDPLSVLIKEVKERIKMTSNNVEQDIFLLESMDNSTTTSSPEFPAPAPVFEGIFSDAQLQEKAKISAVINKKTNLDERARVLVDRLLFLNERGIDVTGANGGYHRSIGGGYLAPHQYVANNVHWHSYMDEGRSINPIDEISTGYTYRVTRCLIALYYCFVSIFFKLLNSFTPQETITLPTDPLLFLSAKKASELIRKRELKSYDLIDAYIRRIGEVNDDINAVALRTFCEARTNAEIVDQMLMELTKEEIEELALTRPLLGVPFTLKDSMCIRGKTTTSGMFARRSSVSTESAPAVQKMLDAGAILLSLTTVPEMCSWIETTSKIFGTTRNPYDLRRTAGGCSGGEGALVGSAGSLVGIASDYVAGLRLPAFFNGVYGFSPSPGVVDTKGHVPNITPYTYQAVMGRVGPICRYAEDLSLIFSVLCEKEIPQTIPENAKIFYSNGLSHLLLIEPTGHSCMRSVMKSHLESDNQLNCTVELIKYATGKSNHSLAGILHGMTDDIDRFTSQEREMLVENRDALRNSVFEMLSPNGLLFFPSFVSTATFHGEQILKRPNIVHTTIANILGLPAVQCPMGLDENNLPLGVMVIGAPGSDYWLLHIAEEIERRFGGWKTPGN